MKKALNFTKSLLDNLLHPQKGKRAYYNDSQVRGLSLAVQASGSKSFYVIKKISGRTEKIYLGAYPHLTIDNARKLAKVNLGQIALGINPLEEKRTVKKEITLGQLFDQYMERYSKPHKKTWQADQHDIHRFFGHWFKRKISDIRRSEIQHLIESIYRENGLYQANKILQRIRAMYNKASDWGWKGSNPTAGIKRYREKSRERFIQPSEMPFLLQSLNEEQDQTARDFFCLLLITGARKTNMLMMRWEHINWEGKEWRIPDTKNGDPVTIPLLEKAMDILKDRRKHSNREWVFPRSNDETKHFVNYRIHWKRLLQKATLYLWQSDNFVANFINPDDLAAADCNEVNAVFRSIVEKAEKAKIKLPVGVMDTHVHDLRRTFGSYQALTGASLPVIGKSLGHKCTQATQIYARLNLDPIRASMEKATSEMFALSNKGSGVASPIIHQQ